MRIRFVALMVAAIVLTPPVLAVEPEQRAAEAGRIADATVFKQLAQRCERWRDNFAIATHDCHCLAVRAQEELDEGTLPRHAIAQAQFESLECIDLAATQQKYLAAWQQLHQSDDYDHAAHLSCAEQAVRESADPIQLREYSEFNEFLKQQCPIKMFSRRP
jgi:hypothetical protein